MKSLLEWCVGKYAENPRSTIRYVVIGIILLLVIAGILTNANAGDVTLEWDPNTETDLAGYRIYYGNAARPLDATPMTFQYSAVVDVKNVTTFKIENLADGTWYFAATAYNTAGLESLYSNEVFTVLTSTGPAGPKNMKVKEAAVMWNGKRMVIFPKGTVP